MSEFQWSSEDNTMNLGQWEEKQEMKDDFFLEEKVTSTKNFLNRSGEDFGRQINFPNFNLNSSFSFDEEFQPSNNILICENMINFIYNDETETVKHISMNIFEQKHQFIQTNTLKKRKYCKKNNKVKVDKETNSEKKLKISSQHNFPKFLCSDLKNIQRKIHKNQKSGQQTIPQINYHYSQFFKEGMIKSAGLRNIRQYLLNQKKSNLEDKFSKFMSSKKLPTLEYKFIDLKNWARSQIIENEMNLIHAAGLRKMKQRLKYIEFVKVVLNNLKAGFIKENHK